MSEQVVKTISSPIVAFPLTSQWLIVKVDRLVDSNPVGPAPAGWRLSCSVARPFRPPLVQCHIYNLGAPGTAAHDNILIILSIPYTIMVILKTYTSATHFFSGIGYCDLNLLVSKMIA